MAGQELELGLAEIGERHGGLRLCRPGAEEAMQRSLERYGQMSPVVVIRGQEGGYELIDGFKRLHGARQLGKMASLKARVLEIGERAAKAAVLCLNWVSRSVTDLEEAWVVRSLCREDGLTQIEVGELLGRDKSWVCRRLSLAERLSEEVQSQMKLGLLSATVGRELARLPRGNQQRVLEAVRTHGLATREAATLVDLVLDAPRDIRESILAAPLEALCEREAHKARKRDAQLSDAADRLKGELDWMRTGCRQVVAAVNGKGIEGLLLEELVQLSRPMREAHAAGRQAVRVLSESLVAIREAQNVGGVQQGRVGARDRTQARSGMVAPQDSPPSPCEQKHGGQGLEERRETAPGGP